MLERAESQCAKAYTAIDEIKKELLVERNRAHVATISKRRAMEENRQSQEQVRCLQSQLEACTEEYQQLRRMASTSCYQQDQQEQLHWAVAREEVALTEEVLGEGAYGQVCVAEFRGIRVAAKFLHRVILSEYNCDLFYREMFIASKVRHPNLVQFIGAVTEGSAIILTELMPTSLTKQLERGRLTCPQILSIATDTTLALNYLHQCKPDPIIHRDLSSSNILLEPMRQDNWRAKVSDFGSANFASLIHRSVNPGNPAYSAPEAGNPKKHSTKMDTFSLGVVLTQMCRHQPPAINSADREKQLEEICWPAMVTLIRQCLCNAPSERLPMNQVLHILKTLKDQPTSVMR